MKITLCGSIAFIDEIDAIKNKLEGLGHEVKLPPLEVMDKNNQPIPAKEYYLARKTTAETSGWIWDRKEEAMRAHFDKVAWSDAIVVVNPRKNMIDGYIGANTLMEMGLAFHLRKPIYLMYQIPEISYKEEILGVRPIMISGDLSRIRQL